MPSPQIQLLIDWKTRGAVTNFDEGHQNRIYEKVIGSSKDKHHPWDWNDVNIGKFIASGLTGPEEFERALGLTVGEFLVFKVGFNLPRA